MVAKWIKIVLLGLVTVGIAWCATFVVNVTVVVPNRCEAEKRELNKMGEQLVRQGVSPSVAISNAKTQGFDAVSEKIDAILEPELSKFDQQVVISPKHNSTAFLNYSIFLTVYYRGGKPSKFEVDVNYYAI